MIRFRLRLWRLLTIDLDYAAPDDVEEVDVTGEVIERDDPTLHFGFWSPPPGVEEEPYEDRSGA